MSSWRSRSSRDACTVDDLIDIIKAPSGGVYVFPSQPYNEVYPGIFIGDAHTALCTGVLRALGISHVVNAAHSTNKREGLENIEEFDPFVRTTDAYYKRAGIKFFPVPAIDLIHFRLAPFFRDAAEFIDDALSTGGESFALDPKALRDAGVTAVVNAAEGMDWCRYVDSGASFYSSVKLPVSYYGIKALDCSTFSLFRFFDSVASFINDNLQAGGKVLVHCKQGISRSSTLVIAFLMLKRGMTAQEAIAIVRSKREIMPNEGFLQQLCDLNERLARERH